MIYKRFTEKAAEEWRQIYKALQLLEFLIKNGSERVIDDARSHLTLLKMLRQFHFIDLSHIPGTYQMTSGIRIIYQAVHNL